MPEVTDNSINIWVKNYQQKEKHRENRMNYYYNLIMKLSEEEFNKLITKLLEKEYENYKTDNLHITSLLYNIAKKYGEEITEDSHRETYDRTFKFRNRLFHGVHGQGFVIFIE